ncbi:putative leader peptide [Actinomadura rubrobrunea]|uniref:putative leader peptide n=1 Tax=Actinomadura rubrobrunea TaxID=115335 RepID=UPI0036F1EF07
MSVEPARNVRRRSNGPNPIRAPGRNAGLPRGVAAGCFRTDALSLPFLLVLLTFCRASAYPRGVPLMTCLTSRGHVDLCRVASALCPR